MKPYSLHSHRTPNLNAASLYGQDFKVLRVSQRPVAGYAFSSPSPRIAQQSAAELWRRPFICKAGFGFGAKAKPECPCGSGRLYTDCCQPYHKSRSLTPEQPQQLIAARYAAFVKKDDKAVRFLRRTSHPDNPALKGSKTAADAGVEKTCSYEEDLVMTFKVVDFLGLKLLGSSSSDDGSSATVDYAVTIKRKVDNTGVKVKQPEEQVIKERASLLKDSEGRWQLLDAKAI